MEGQKRNYDTVAGYYDWLSRLVFGQSLIRAQTDLLHFLQNGDKILIVGGGTGELLKGINECAKQQLQVIYVEASAKMLEKARNRNLHRIKVEFIHSVAEKFEPSQPFDIIMTPYLFDNYNTKDATSLLRHLSAQLQPSGYWLFTDFHTDTDSPAWQKLLLRIMYKFFQTMAGIQARALPEMEKIFREQHFKKIFETRRYRNFIQSAVWQKQGS